MVRWSRKHCKVSRKNGNKKPKKRLTKNPTGEKKKLRIEPKPTLKKHATKKIKDRERGTLQTK